MKRKGVEDLPKVIVPYTEETFEDIVTQHEAEGLLLKEVRRVTEGNFLVFSPPAPPTPEERIQALEEALLALMFSGGGDA